MKRRSWQKIYSREYGVFYSQMIFSSVSPLANQIIPAASKTHFIVSNRSKTEFYAKLTEWTTMAKSLEKKYAKNLNELLAFEKKLFQTGKKYVATAQKISKLRFKTLKNREILKYYTDYCDDLFLYTIYVAVAFILNNHLAEKAILIIKKYLVHQSIKVEQEILDSLFSPQNPAAIFRLQRAVEKSGTNINQKQIIHLYNIYKWLPCQDIHNQPWTQEEFNNVIAAFKKKPKAKRKFEQYAKILKIKKTDLEYLMIAKRLVYLKDKRDDFRRQGVYSALPFFAEIAKRMKLTLNDLTYFKISEIAKFLKKNILPERQILAQRKKGFIMYFEKSGKVVCISGPESLKELVKFKIKENNLSQKITGQVASGGKTQGVVAIVNGIKDLSKVKNNSILVAATTHPDYTIAMRKAAAIITDEGGITSHAAIVSREYGIPCIVGTQNATKILKDGDLVKVDAEKGTVVKLTLSS